MGVKDIALKQYKNKVNQAVKQFEGISQSLSESWLKTVRLALGMSGPQLAKRMGVTKGRISQVEAAEIEGGVTLKTMKAMAEAMNCRFVYAVIPEGDIEQVIKERAIKKAKERVKIASTHMALEAQTLDKETLNSEIERIALEIIREKRSDLWSDK